jgi:hypothetical protein
MVGNTPVTVGNNPTAVAVYPAATESNTSTMTSGDTIGRNGPDCNPGEAFLLFYQSVGG